MGKPAAIALLGVLFACSGCRESPEDVVRAAIAAGQLEDADTYYSAFTARSAATLRGLDPKTSKELGGVLRYWSSSLALLPDGVVSEAQVDGNRAVLSVDSARGKTEILMIAELGEWRIDAFALDGFWEPLAK
jgi:hypothetical protein